MKVLGRYKNGNYMVTIFDDGTKIRENDLDNLTPAFAENCDVKITDKCDGACQFCYEGCSAKGEHGDILNYKFLDTLHPYTELAINGNDLSHPDLVPFMEKMKEKKVILNMTVNQIHFERYFGTIKEWIDKGLIFGLGISLRNPTYEFIEKVKQIPNAVIHVINGIVTMPELDTLAGNNLKLLILGYKRLNRGEEYFEENEEQINGFQEDLKRYLFSTIIPQGWFKVVSFDNLAISQLDVKSNLSEEKWEEFYMGDDGTYTFYLDLVDGTFSKNSISRQQQRFPIMDNIDDMFYVVQAYKELEFDPNKMESTIEFPNCPYCGKKMTTKVKHDRIPDLGIGCSCEEYQKHYEEDCKNKTWAKENEFIMKLFNCDREYRTKEDWETQTKELDDLLTHKWSSQG